VLVVTKDTARKTIRPSLALPPIATREDLILSKLVWAKPSGSELQLRDVRALLAGGADLGYLRRWAADLGVTGLLEKSLE